MKKVIISCPDPTSADKAEAVRGRVAAHLGMDVADVLVLSGVGVTVVDVADAKPPVDAVTPPSLPAWTAKSKPKE